MQAANEKFDIEIIKGLDVLFSRAVGQIESGKDEVIYPELTNNTPFFELTWDLNRAEDQDKLISQIVAPEIAELKGYLVSRGKRSRESAQALLDQARASCLFFVEQPEGHDLQRYFNSRLSRVKAPTDAEDTKAFFRKVMVAVFPEDTAKPHV